jgi:arylsulfatase A-like enzyme
MSRPGADTRRFLPLAAFRVRPVTISNLLVALLAAGLAASCSQDQPEPDFKVNVILIAADDLGHADMGFMGASDVETPNLDRLAREGTVFGQGQHAASVCRPTLRALLTGLEPYQWSHQVEGHGRPGYEMSDLDTLPRLLGEAGYLSFQAGKIWESGYDVPGFTSGMNPSGESSSKGGSGAMLGRDSIAPAIEFLEERAGGDRPFFLWFFPRLPHTPHDAGAEYTSRYAGRGHTPATVEYYANITRFDDVVGSLLTRLDELDLTRRTLVVFLTDNGWELPPRDQDQPSLRTNQGKKTLREIGFRTPIVFRLPGRIESGRRIEGLVSIMDVFPTLLSYAGVATPPDLAGLDLEPVLAGREQTQRDAVIGWMDGRDLTHKGRPPEPSGFFLRDRDWRYIWYPTVERDELYKVPNDPHEASDRSGDEPALVEAFRRRIKSWERKLRKSKKLPGGGRPSKTSPGSPGSPREIRSRQRIAPGSPVRSIQ